MSDDASLWRRKKWLRVCVRVLVTLIVLAGGVKLWFWHALRSELAALHASGGPVTWDEVCDSIEPIPDEENSALVLLPALENFRGCWSESSQLAMEWSASSGTRPSDEMQRLMRAVLSDRSAALATLHEAAKYPRGRWPIEQTRSRRWHDPESYQLRDALPLLSLEATLYAAEGDSGNTAQAVLTMLRVGASLDEAPYLSSHQLRLRFVRNAALSLAHTLDVCAMSSQDLAMLRKAFATEAEQMSLRTMFLGERASFLCYVKDYSFSDREHYGLLAKVLHFVPGLLEADMLYGLECLKKDIALLDLPPREQIRQARVLFEARVAKIKYTDGCCCYDANSLRNWRLVSICECPELARALINALRTKQWLHTGRAALAAEQFRVEHGRWPAKLADLVPKYLDVVPQDWYGPAGSTIRYLRTPTGVRLWSAYARHGEYPDGLTGIESADLKSLARNINEFNESEGRIPKSLSELVPGKRDSLPIDGRTGKPYTYVTNPVNPALFILDGFTDGMSEAEFWKQKSLTTEEWVGRYPDRFSGYMFCLLNPELRGAQQMRFPDEVEHGREYDRRVLHELGYTPERLKELGFSEDAVRDYVADIERAESRREYEAEKARDERRRAGLPALPVDTQVEPAP